MNPYTGIKNGDLLQLRRPQLLQHIQTALTGVPEIAAAYLFGSALSFVRPQSDIDVALITKKEISPTFLLEGTIKDRLARFGPHSFHVTVRPDDKINFSFQVLTKGELIYVADHNKLGDFIERVTTVHRDHERLLAVYERARGWVLHV